MFYDIEESREAVEVKIYDINGGHNEIKIRGK